MGACIKVGDNVGNCLYVANGSSEGCASQNLITKSNMGIKICSGECARKHTATERTCATIWGPPRVCRFMHHSIPRQTIDCVFRNDLLTCPHGNQQPLSPHVDGGDDSFSLSAVRSARYDARMLGSTSAMSKLSHVETQLCSGPPAISLLLLHEDDHKPHDPHLVELYVLRIESLRFQ
ncbi:hypothetical protein DOTSEDRAFT_82704 [Dothistroma septosporum NZE10]|uniref:Uncharacterized protein n=1 Tax=Dothistroma septosporum (strain NZE10 / CBS 128990) TaxID=675120 RepID=N1PEE7_DOTSN|nr:hypothetical protein DOTSEDRAFT_82704 [Dothistroma septosporum NZE10]